MVETAPPSARPKRQHGCVGCLTISLGVAIVLPVGMLYLRHQSRLGAEQRRADLRQKWFHDVKNGSHLVSVLDSRLLPMLASDADCVAVLDQLSFAMVDVAPEDAEHIAQLINVRHISFYDTRGADYVLLHARGLAIETLSFDKTRLSDDSLRGLAGFPRLTKVRFGYADAHALAILRGLPPGITVETQDSSDGGPSR